MEHTPASLDETARVYLRARDVDCPGCGYNRRDGADASCPECGHVLLLSVTGDAERSLSRSGPRWLFATVLALSGLHVVVHGFYGVFTYAQRGAGFWPLSVHIQIIAVPLLYLAVLILARFGLRAYRRSDQTSESARRVILFMRASALSLILVALGMYTFQILFFFL